MVLSVDTPAALPAVGVSTPVTEPFPARTRANRHAGPTCCARPSVLSNAVVAARLNLTGHIAFRHCGRASLLGASLRARRSASLPPVQTPVSSDQKTAGVGASPAPECPGAVATLTDTRAAGDHVWSVVAPLRQPTAPGHRERDRARGRVVRSRTSSAYRSRAGRNQQPEPTASPRVEA
jgi:hypothetical protein